VFRAVEKYTPTLLIDEADTFLRDKDELRGILNSGHTRANAFVVRTVGDDHEAATFSTWSPVAVAMIGRLPATLEDRALVIRMRRRTPAEKVERLRADRLHELEPLRRKAARFAADNLVRIGAADPPIPPFASDRTADNWRPLLAIADAAGGPWPKRAREAARQLAGDELQEDGDGVLLLGDIHDLFVCDGTDRLTSDRIVQALKEMEERPWPEFRHGQPITARQAARLLKPFDISPKVIKLTPGHTARGYHHDDFEDAFDRYLASASALEGVTDVTSLEKGTFLDVTADEAVTHGKQAICSQVTQVTHPEGEPAPEALPLPDGGVRQRALSFPAPVTVPIRVGHHTSHYDDGDAEDDARRESLSVVQSWSLDI
jgi:putative DNA primase/helicase